MPEPIYPSPALSYQGSGSILQPMKIVLGTSTIATIPATSMGFNFSNEVTQDGRQDIRIRPNPPTPLSGPTPCNFIAYFYYEQKGIDGDMVFSLASDKGGGVAGTAAALEVHSNYPDISMNLEKFKFVQHGIGTQVRGKLPSDYVARIALKFWLEDAQLAVDGWIRFETFYVKEPTSAAVAKPPPVLVDTGKATFYPSEGGEGVPVLGIPDD
jgi:hypothetical protein